MGLTLIGAKQLKKQPFEHNYHEKNAWAAGMLVCGIDEVGRGCLAGPVVAGAVILPPQASHPLLRDSKKLNSAQLNEAYAWITVNCRYSVGVTHNRIIDQVNIWHATLIAMKKAVLPLLVGHKTVPAAILIDAMPLTLARTGFEHIAIESFTKGEDRSSSIAAASIVAKVTRDRIMEKFDCVVSGYDFASHKGYGTECHRAALTTGRPSLIHRTSFLKNCTPVHEVAHEQQTIC